MASILRPALHRQASSAIASSTSSRAAIFGSPLSSAVAVRHSGPKLGAGVVAFHASSRRNLLPPLPQTVEGSVNDPAPIPPQSPSHGSYHWTFERLIAAGLVPLTIAPFAAGSLNPTMDAVLCATVLVHAHIGFQSVIVDYLPTRRVPKTRKAAMWGLNVVTALVGLGLYEFETNDVGVTEAIKRVWKA